MGPKTQIRTERPVTRTNVGLRVDRRYGPKRAVMADRRSRETQLIRRARQFDVCQPRALGSAFRYAVSTNCSLLFSIRSAESLRTCHRWESAGEGQYLPRHAAPALLPNPPVMTRDIWVPAFPSSRGFQLEMTQKAFAGSPAASCQSIPVQSSTPWGHLVGSLYSVVKSAR